MRLTGPLFRTAGSIMQSGSAICPIRKHLHPVVPAVCRLRYHHGQTAYCQEHNTSLPAPSFYGRWLYCRLLSDFSVVSPPCISQISGAWPVLNQSRQPAVVISQKQYQIPDPAQFIKNLVNFRPSVAQIAKADQHIILFVKTGFFKTLNQCPVSPMDVAYDESSHGAKVI